MSAPAAACRILQSHMELYISACCCIQFMCPVCSNTGSLSQSRIAASKTTTAMLVRA